MNPRTVPVAGAGAAPRAARLTRRRLALGALAAIPLVALLPLPDFWVTQLNGIALYSLTCLGLVLLTGIAGLTSFGQAAFVGIGAYTTGWLTLHLGWSPWLTLPAGLAITGASALVLALVTLRMSGHYLPLATIAWGLSLYYLMGNLDALGKYDGLLGLKSLSLFGLDLGQGRGFFLLAWTLVALAATALLHLLDSRVGRALRALKSAAGMAESVGIGTLRYQVLVFVIAALFACLAGWLLAHFQRTVNPTAFGLKMGIEYLFMTVVGGVGHVWGAITGAALTRLLDDQLQVLLPRLIGTSGSYEVIVFGVALVLVLKYQPGGLWDVVERRLPPARRPHDWGDAPALVRRARPAAGEPVLQVAGLRKEFGGLVAVNDVAFEVRGAEIVGLIGPNGAGKTTIFHMISGALPPTRGSVRFAGRATERLPAREIARLGLARTFQHVRLVPEMTVLENAALGAHARGRRGVLSAMARLDRAEERSLFREAQRQLERVGMGAHLHEPAGNLAMGQQRLLEIARALCADPALLLLDEPAAGLRHQEKRALAQVLRQLCAQGMSILLVEHDMDLVMQVCQRLVVMEFGTLLMQGTPREVQRSAAVRAAYLGTEH